MRPRRHLLIAALVIGLAFLGITLAWEQSSAYPSTWGDSTANAMGAALAVDLHARAGLTRLLLGPEIMFFGPRGPLHYQLATAWLALFGGRHLALVIFQALLVLITGWTLAWITARETRSTAAGLVALGLFLTAAETIVQAHSFFLEVSTALWGAVALLALRPAREGARWGVSLLGLALGAGLLSRHHSAVAVAIPVGLCALPAMLRSLRRRPVATTLAGLGFPAAAALASLVVGLASSAPREPPLPSGPWGSNLLLLLLLVVAGALAPRLLRDSADPDADRGVGLAMAMGTAVAVALPWYLAFPEAVVAHFEGSSGPDLLRASAALPMIRFELLCLGLRQLSPLGLLLLLPAAAWALQRRDATSTQGLVGLLWAAVAFPFFFHARYDFVLIVWALPLLVAWVASRGPLLRRSLFAALLALGLVRIAGWATPLPLAPLPPDDFRDEGITWHRLDSPESAASLRRWATPRLTLAPMPPPDLLGRVVDDALGHCASPPCSLRIQEVPADFQPRALFDEPDTVRYYLRFVRGWPRLSFARGPVGDERTLLLVIGGRAPDLSTTAGRYPGRELRELERYDTFGSGRAALFELAPR
jgi:hypothetical protein